MKSMTKFAIACLITGISTSAGAAQSDFRHAVRAESGMVGVPTGTLNALVRDNDRNCFSVRDAVLEKLQAAEMIHSETAKGLAGSMDNATARGDGWSLQVAGKGHWIRYRNMAAIDNGSSPVAKSHSPSATVLEKQARTAISKYLTDLIPMADGETMELWSTAVEIRGGQDMEGNREESIYNTKVTFTRVIEGVPVVGNGSKVVVILSTKGEMVGFDIDWSPLKQSKRITKVVALSEIMNRAEMIKPLMLNKYKEATYRNDALECGYYDVGARANSTESIEPACIVYRSSDVGNGQIMTVPAGEQVRSDAKWPESQLLKRVAQVK